MTIIESFAAIANKNARVLVLGSMPSEASLEENQYYAHPRNSFWSIMTSMFNAGSKLDYEEGKKLISQHRIALWDVLKSCVREGSLDSSINDASVIVNDFDLFYSEHPNVSCVYFNGMKAEKEYNRHVLPIVSEKYQYLEYYRLPSTSPAMAVLKVDEKLARWSIVKEKLQSLL